MSVPPLHGIVYSQNVEVDIEDADTVPARIEYILKEQFEFFQHLLVLILNKSGGCVIEEPFLQIGEIAHR